ncbi:type A chloramphenicol O-acetyltransferase [Desulfitobacterium chlororespirans]|uniref:Chloramphenicol O-acetyltransferase type A n=1 Tax=Desulfitobacterium chlororespirans DSM 11544 TaxID=1121395 RepID=A0A1M7UWK3_9FIRM|nr:type A chloramphenicol O-acetyltransferase [Desulfitobacterium chlororespirans]SHN87266.1 chloramphenicol O-acetyltransferase type A [Desulfitobacterium chlororespirans DSM 11544]
MKFIEVEMEQWARKKHYEHYSKHVRCSYSLTVEIDISGLLTGLKAKGRKAYPAQIYMLSAVANQFQEFRMSTNEEKRLGYWDVINPMYTVLNRETETFSAIWTKYDSCFHRFYRACLEDATQYANGVLFPQDNLPPNIFNISSIPWLDFTAFNLNVPSQDNYLLPIFTIGKYRKEKGKTLMPLAIQCHHAVCDGLHVGRFIDALRYMAVNWDEWL